MRRLLASLALAIGRPMRLASLDPVLADLNRAERDAIRRHGPVKHIRKARTARLHAIMGLGR